VGTECPFDDQEHAKGDYLFHEGDAAEQVWFIKRGTVVLHRSSGDEGDARARAVRRPGSFVGLEALVRPRYLDSARTSEPTTACRASKRTIDEWLGAPGTPARTALEQVLLTEAEEPQRAASPDGTATRRVARWILQSVSEGADYQLPRRDVAGLLGMVPETFSRALAALSRVGAIETTRRHLRIKDALALRNAAGT
jgi:CRP-like cAMP-binding protein